MNALYIFMRGHWRAVCVGLGIILVFVLLSVGTLLRWKHADLVGTIVAIDGLSCTVSNSHGDEMLVVLADTTRMHKGRTKDATLTVGDTVVIVGETDEYGVVHARMIRILEPHGRSSRPAP
jgi:hypothetical protein